MTSGAWLTWGFLFGLFILFPAFEFLQLYRRRKGNKTARTLTQYVTWRAEENSKFFKVFVVAFPVVVMLLGVWLLFHFEGLCLHWGFACSLSEAV